MHKRDQLVFPYIKKLDEAIQMCRNHIDCYARICELAMRGQREHVIVQREASRLRAIDKEVFAEMLNAFPSKPVARSTNK